MVKRPFSYLLFAYNKHCWATMSLVAADTTTTNPQPHAEKSEPTTINQNIYQPKLKGYYIKLNRDKRNWRQTNPKIPFNIYN